MTMITNKQRVKVFLKKLDRLRREFNANIRGQAAFYDMDTEKWTDWLSLEASGDRATIKYVGPDTEPQEAFDPQEKLEEMHADLLRTWSEVLKLQEMQLKAKKNTTRKPTTRKPTTRKPRKGQK
jgi:hypothetical protein